MSILIQQSGKYKPVMKRRAVSAGVADDIYSLDSNCRSIDPADFMTESILKSHELNNCANAAKEGKQFKITKYYKIFKNYSNKSSKRSI